MAGRPTSNAETPNGGAAPLAWARGELMTRHGKVAGHWKVESGKPVGAVTISANMRAAIILPGRKPQKVAAGQWEFSVPFGK